MRKLLFWASVFCMVLGSAHMAAALEIKTKGYFDYGFGWYSGDKFTKHGGGDNFDAGQVFRGQMEFVADESLSGVAIFEIGTTYWGNGGGDTWGSDFNAGRGAGGAMGSDGVNVELKHLYIDWILPQTDMQVRMGLQAFALPNAVWRADYLNGGVVVDDDAPGIVVSNTFTENIGLSLGWFRPWNPYTNEDYNFGANRDARLDHDALDAFFLTLPIDVQGSFNLTPYFMYASVGEVDTDPDAGGELSRNGMISYSISSNGSLGDNGQAWWTGLAFSFTHFEPFNAYLDLVYGSYTADDVDPTPMTNTRNPDRDGWVAVSKIEYILEYFTPNIFGWYGSGTDSLRDDGFDGMMPGLSPFFGLTSFGFSSDRNDIVRQMVLGFDPYGKWGVGIGLDNINIIEDLTSHFRVMYMRGTNDTNGLDTAFWDYGAFDRGDQAIEINLDSIYNIYENLELHVDLAYINLDLENKPSGFEQNAWKAYTMFRYTF